MTNGLLKKLGVGLLVGNLAVCGLGEIRLDSDACKVYGDVETYYNASASPNCLKSREDNVDIFLQRSSPGEPLQFNYSNWGFRNNNFAGKPRSSISQGFLDEDSNNTHIYFVYNNAVEIKGYSQKLKVCANGTGKVSHVATVPNMDTDITVSIKKINDFLKIENTQDNPYEELYDYVTQKSGKMEVGMVCLKEVANFGLSKAEELRIEILREKYPGYNIEKMPLYSMKNISFGCKRTGRFISLSVGCIPGRGKPSLFVEIPQVRFVKPYPNDIEANIRDIVIEFDERDIK